MEVRPGYKETEVGVIPEDWELCQLGRIADLERGKFTARPRNQPKFFGGDIPFIQTGDITNSGGTITTYAQTLNDEGLRVSKLFPRDTLFFTIAANIGDVGIATFETAATDSVIAISPRRAIEKRWLYHSLRWQKETFEGLATQNAQANINLEKLRPYPLAVPPLPEQRAIAEALSDVDELLGALDRLIAKKRDLKQAAMQQLLTGQTRLPGFTGKWRETTLGELATFLSGGTPSRSNSEYWTGDIPWISASSLRCFEIWQSDSNVTREAVAAGSKMAPVGSSLMLVRGSALHKEILCGLVTKPVCFNQDVKALVPRSMVVPRFLTLFIRGTAEEFLKLVSSAGNTAGVLDTKLLRAFAINLPNIQEQTAIAEVLSDMDGEITSLEQRREKTRALKQGMMQELLTGRTRLI